MVDGPPPYPYIPLNALLERVSQTYPQLFYKPLFSCAASTKEFTVASHLCVITILSKFLSDFWTRDAEMMSVALMSGASGGTNKEPLRVPTWGTARLGQCVLLVELIGHIQAVRRAKEASLVSNESLHPSSTS